jgi:hypothetical protein
MQTITLKAHTDRDGIIKLEIPTNIMDHEVEIVLVVQPVTTEPVDDMGYPIGYFEDTYGSFVDEPLERNQPIQHDTRDKLE